MMEEATLKTSLEGRIRNLKHFKSEALLPLFEAVVNSIQAIEDVKPLAEGRITVRIVREKRAGSQANLELEEEDQLPKIVGFEIEDDGIGFNDTNFESFKTADSTYKLSKGGKGIGRFLWLKAFDRVEVFSTYLDDDDLLKTREFIFSVDENIREIESTEVPTGAPRTVVRLCGFRDEYRTQPSAFKKSSKIAQRILEHCLPRYIAGVAPDIVVVDDHDTSKIRLTDLYSEVQEHISAEEIRICDHDFFVHHIRLYGTRGKTHQLVYCAHGRDVMRLQLAKLLGTSVQFDDDEKKFFYSAYVTSPLLDGTVDQYRQEFDLPETTTLGNENEPSWDQVERGVVGAVRTHLAPLLTSIQNQKVDKLSKLVQDEYPSLRAVIKYCPEAVDEIELSTSPERTVQILYAHKGRAEFRIRTAHQNLLKSQKMTLEEVEQRHREFVASIDAFKKDDLAGYMVFRKMVIEVLEKKLQINTEGRYANEDIIHDIVLPRKTDTDSIGDENHNLWLIDELLTFHMAAKSDLPLNSYTSSESLERPDIVVFSEISEDLDARAVSIVEFKKPQRVSFDQDPTTQLFNYVRQIQGKGIMLPNGRPVRATDTTKFYCYAICDITDKIREFAENHGYSSMPDSKGYFFYNSRMKTSIEIIAFDRIVLDAKKRHKAFFERLGI